MKWLLHVKGEEGEGVQLLQGSVAMDVVVSSITVSMRRQNVLVFFPIAINHSGTIVLRDVLQLMARPSNQVLPCSLMIQNPAFVRDPGLVVFSMRRRSELVQNLIDVCLAVCAMLAGLVQYWEVDVVAEPPYFEPAVDPEAPHGALVYLDICFCAVCGADPVFVVSDVLVLEVFEHLGGCWGYPRWY